MLQRTFLAGFIAPCLPTKTDKLPSGSQWLHEIKHDGFRVIARKDGDRVRLYSRPGNDMTRRFPLIAEALTGLRSRSCIIDGEAVACDDNGLASFERIRYRHHDGDVFLYAFDLIELNGDDLRRDPLQVRKATLASILAKARPGIRFNEHIEADGPTVFAHACKMGLEGIVSKRKDSAYRSGRSPDWLKMKNPEAPAVKREAEEERGLNRNGGASMANDEHVAILKKGVAAWNAWRDENPDIGPDLIRAALEETKLWKANLYKANLNKADLIRANLQDANLSEADLNEADLNEADLQNANLSGADLSRADLSRADLRWADLSNANFSTADLSAADLYGADLSGAHLNETDLRGAHLNETDLSGAHLSNANFGRAILSEARLIQADLGGADLSEADLSGADLSGADLGGADLSEADLSGADLSGADLSGVSLTDARLDHANLTRANITGADLSGAFLRETVFGDTTLSEVKGLDQCRHMGPSIIDFRTLKKSALFPHRLGFLRGIGLSDNLIDHLPSILNEARQHYSCFISYSSKDQAFAERLHADLQNKGVRCWFAPHDMRIGAKIIDALDEGIRLRDKMLLILSEGAIASDWVEGEVTRALEEERTRKQVVLFPVRLDDAVMETSEGWARLLRAQRNIGDFTRWKEHDSYQRSFDRLMRDLRVEKPGQ